MFKQELPLMFPDDADVQAVQEAMFDPFEYLVARHRDGLLKTDFKPPLGKVSYHVPCHGRVQKIGRKTEEMFKLIGQTVAVELNTVERCSGHAGTYGVKTPTHPVAMKIGKPVFKAMAKRRRPTSSAPTARWPATTSRRAWRTNGCRAAAAAPSAEPAAPRLRALTSETP